MTAIELIADACARSLELLKMTVGDFSDADMMARPCPGANHAAWQIGHLVCSETRMINACRPGTMPELPAGFAEKFTGKTAASDDRAAFATKEQLLDLAARARAASVKFVKGLTEKDLNQPGPEKMRAICPTLGHLVMLLPNHAAMHIGQIQAIRRKLGKPNLF